MSKNENSEIQPTDFENVNPQDDIISLSEPCDLLLGGSEANLSESPIAGIHSDKEDPTSLQKRPRPKRSYLLSPTTSDIGVKRLKTSMTGVSRISSLLFCSCHNPHNNLRTQKGDKKHYFFHPQILKMNVFPRQEICQAKIRSLSTRASC
ncbi:hypothetical protein BDQ17DRAFT_1341798 [Cyathus striatus]|nr:hypothetical protein BDQ17DRAFT_1341798 [Cyathus striatus]